MNRILTAAACCVFVFGTGVLAGDALAAERHIIRDEQWSQRDVDRPNPRDWETSRYGRDTDKPLDSREIRERNDYNREHGYTPQSERRRQEVRKDERRHDRKSDRSLRDRRHDNDRPVGWSDQVRPDRNRPDLNRPNRPNLPDRPTLR